VSKLATLLGLVAAAALCVGVAATAAGTLIGPQQHFVGFVNGHTGKAVVYTVCPGPASDGETGQVETGQTFEVARAKTKGGDTGVFGRILAWFVPQPGGARPVQVGFTRYRSPKPIPSTVRVPCGGTGRVEFSSCPYLAPCAAGWIPTYVAVRFENIAA
jgi:hypothetical protein